MREYKPQSNAQKEVHYKDRFYVAPRIPREPVTSDAVYCADVERLGAEVQVIESYIERGTLVVWVEKDSVYRALECLKAMGYDILSELSAMDYLQKKGGFEIFYQMLAMDKAKRLRVKTFLKKGERIESVTG